MEPNWPEHDPDPEGPVQGGSNLLEKIPLKQEDAAE
jgi:hypothetical protein